MSARPSWWSPSRVSSSFSYPSENHEAAEYRYLLTPNAIYPFLTMSWRIRPRYGTCRVLGAFAAKRRPCPAVSRLQPLIVMVAILFSTVLSARSGTVLMLALLACAMDALPATAGSERLTHAPLSGVTRPPVGWMEFCARQPNECAGGTMPLREFILTPKAGRMRCGSTNG